MENTNVNIDNLIRVAEQQQLQLTAKATFEKNMRYFQENVPDFYTTFKDYTPHKFQITPYQGHWDILDIETNTILYNQDPITLAETSSKQFLSKPYCNKLSLLPVIAYGVEDEAHITNINKMLENLEALKSLHQEVGKLPIEESCRLLIVHGIGLGYHIISLLEQTEIQHLSIVEPELDFFFASLHTIDWAFVCEKYLSDDKTINFVLGQDPQDSIKDLAKHINNIGLFSFARTYIFTHLKTHTVKKIVSLFYEHMKIRMSGLGYFDDERLGLAHTIENIRRGANLLDFKRQFPTTIEKIPVFVVANGPSLDLATDFLKANRGNAIVISCGSALGSLYELNIKPDIHVEMERIRPQVEWIEETTSEEFRRGILLLTINTTHPDMIPLFDQCAMGLKPSDTGSLYLIEKLGTLAYNTHLNRCNPTVGNAGLSFACALGFEQVYLFGLDLGIPSSGLHHSTHSAHYKMKDEAFDALGFNGPVEKGDSILPGNFGGEVTSSIIYATALHNVESLLAENPAVHCFNTSNGALIKGAKPTPITDISLNTLSFNKKDYIGALLKQYKLPSLEAAVKDEAELQLHFSQVNDLIEQLSELVETNICSSEQAWSLLDKLHQKTLALRGKTKYGSCYFIIKGSIEAFLLILANYLFINTDEEQKITYLNEAITQFKSFLQQTKVITTENLFEIDSKNFDLGSTFEK